MEGRIKKIYHREEYRLAIITPYKNDRIEQIRKIPRRKYSKTHRCWYLPCDRNSYYALASLSWITDMPPLASLLDHTSSTDTEATPSEPTAHISSRPNNKSQKVYARPISEFWMEKVCQFEIYLRSLRYADSSIKLYVMSVKMFLAWWGDRPSSELSLEHLHIYSDQTFVKRNRSRSAQNQWVTAMRLFLKNEDGINIDEAELKRPRKSSYLPEILSEAEVKKLIESYGNYKHRTIILMYYACGLRKSELLDLEIKDIDSERNVIRIRNSKGAKDRDIALPQMVLKMLRRYYMLHEPTTYLFNGKPGGRYSASSVDKILAAGLKRVGIKKRIKVHNLRHSYATHLVENHVNLRYIQEALGHRSSKTTERYTTLSSEHIAKMVSPIDKWGDMFTT